MPIVCVSGGFDPVHIGHLCMFNDAANYGEVIVIVNSDAWLWRKKGYVFMPWTERVQIIGGFRSVFSVEEVNDFDDTVCEALRRIKPDYFANGGDRTDENTPEKATCKELGIEMLWNVGGGKIASSQGLVNAVR